MEVSKHLQDKLALLPDCPGCYLMKNENQDILYVGKAKILKNRVRSYFHGVHDYKTTKLVQNIRDFEFIVTSSEKEALLLEINLIKKHRPPFNIMLMDDSSYPYIAMSQEEHFRVYTTRNIKNKKATYYGPYPSAQSATQMVRLIHTLFPIRKCDHMPKKACLYYHMHQCKAPCIHEIDSNENKEMKNSVRKFLQGDTKEILSMLQSQMEQASELLQFEKAQQILQSIEAIKHIEQKQLIDFQDGINRDVFGFYEDKGYVSFQGFFIRQGKLLERTFAIQPIYEDTMDAFLSFIMQYYQNNIVPKEILVPRDTPIDILADSLNTKVKIPIKGEKKKLVDLVIQNAKEAHEQKFALVERKEKDLQLANQHLNEICQKEVHVVELFDNSHLSGTYNVSGLVVYKDGLPDKNQYRHYQLKEKYRSDLDSMKEVLYRRYFRLLMEQKKFPDLLLVDGGKLQVQVAKEIKNELDLPLLIMGLVKDDKHTTRALINENLEEIELKKEDPLFFLLTRMQDEVHRFAISYHRNLRKKGMTQSILDGVNGIGPKRKKALMKHFKSVKQMKLASLEELMEVVPEQVAQDLFEALHE
ncbi:excinuclease ABC subunit UvrC [Floccifex sp.]|uniref:excinuclease ABC subunit UvrC n=1 Tax=Floccifex sp. TaxID=2815810 RepID=UPI003F089AC5